MVTRAVHLEIVNSLSAIDFLNGLRRFIARRGKPVLIISDNATNFTLGCEIIARLKLAIKLDSTVLQIQREAIEFKCNVAATALSGCYNCYKGAVATIDCSADTPRATAQATCGHQQFVLTCTREGKENQIRLFFNKARVREQCRVRCGTQTTILEIYGTLNYINGMRPFWKYTKLWNNSTQADQDSFTIEWEFPDIAHFIDVCRSFYIYTVVVLISLPAAAFIVASYLCAAKTTTTRTASTASTLPFLLVPAFVLCSLFKISQRIVSQYFNLKILKQEYFQLLTSFLPVLDFANFSLLSGWKRKEMENQDEAIQAMEEVEEEIPVEPGNEEAAGGNEDQRPPEQEPQRPPRVEYRALDEPRVPPEADELSAVHRKVNRILGRSEDIQPMKNRLGSVSKTTRSSNKIKNGQSSKIGTKSLRPARREETLLHAIDQRTTTMKAVVDRTMVGLEQVYNQQKDILKELGEQKDILKNLAAAPPRRRSPQPGPSHQVDGSNSQQLKCALCDGNHHACDCKRFRTLSDRKRRLDERKRWCERCLLKGNHVATSCPNPSYCFYCRKANRDDDHHSAFCPHKFKF
ncbi:hypothetical protein OSTOST_14443 [Ostertagia ostertagi]